MNIKFDVMNETGKASLMSRIIIGIIGLIMFSLNVYLYIWDPLEKHYDLNKIVLFSFYEIVAFSLMITLLICFIIKICFSIYFKSTSEYMYVKASLYVLPVFIMLFILIILSTFIVNNENKKLYKRMKL